MTYFYFYLLYKSSQGYKDYFRSTNYLGLSFNKKRLSGFTESFKHLFIRFGQTLCLKDKNCRSKEGRRRKKGSAVSVWMCLWGTIRLFKTNPKCTWKRGTQRRRGCKITPNTQVAFIMAVRQSRALHLLSRATFSRGAGEPAHTCRAWTPAVWQLPSLWTFRG